MKNDIELDPGKAVIIERHHFARDIAIRENVLRSMQGSPSVSSVGSSCFHRPPEELQQKAETEEGCLEQTALQGLRVELLRSHHGIGILTGLCLVHTLESAERFANPRKVMAYLGFDPVEDSTGERYRMGSISKQGSRMLHSLPVEAAQWRGGTNGFDVMKQAPPALSKLRACL